MSRLRTRLTGGALLGVTALVLGAVTSTGIAGATAAKPQYYKVKSVCSAPRAAHASCFALRLVRSTSAAAGARMMPRSMAAAAGPAGGYSPAQLAKAYGVNSDASTSQVVGIVDAYDDPTALADLNHFDDHYGLPHETSSSFKKFNQTGGTTYPSTDTNWAGEITLDLDAVRGLCHKCKIVLIEATNNSYANFAVAEKQALTKGATIVSNSWGGAEGGSANTTLKNAFDQPKKVIVASTGDDGYYGWDHLNASGGSPDNAPSEPATLNTVVAAGGTSLQLNDDGTRSSEAVWNENGRLDITGQQYGSAMGAEGGGCSTLYSAQSWQTGVAGWSGTNCGTKRLAADVSALADPYTGYDIYDSTANSGAVGWQTFGGTSLSSPLTAAFFALAGGAHGVKYPAQTLYKNFKSTPKDFYDVTEGGNGFCGGTSGPQCAAWFDGSGAGGPNEYFGARVDCAFKGTTSTLTNKTRACDAATGYDGPTGVGTPNGVNGFKP